MRNRVVGNVVQKFESLSGVKLVRNDRFLEMMNYELDNKKLIAEVRLVQIENTALKREVTIYKGRIDDLTEVLLRKDKTGSSTI